MTKKTIEESFKNIEPKEKKKRCVKIIKKEPSPKAPRAKNPFPYNQYLEKQCREYNKKLDEKEKTTRKRKTKVTHNIRKKKQVRNNTKK